MAKLTQEQKVNYLKWHGVHCPFCDSTQIEGGSVEVNDGGAFQEVNCLDCESEWHDMYTLTDVETD